jgi:hypothetical protein
MNEENLTIESLIKGGLIGTALGALLAKDKEDGAVMGALLGAAIAATLKANEAAQKTKVPVYVEEDGKLYEINQISGKRFIRNIKKSTVDLPQQFKLK